MKVVIPAPIQCVALRLQFALFVLVLPLSFLLPELISPTTPHMEQRWQHTVGISVSHPDKKDCDECQFLNGNVEY
ncbi:hypothetical protein F2P79_023896 [Pimephales promelas]|nr:hypothetical protein F2P79_023896 [Pimephales promelas]